MFIFNNQRVTVQLISYSGPKINKYLYLRERHENQEWRVWGILSLRQVVRGFSSFALFFDWTGGFDYVMSALSRDVHCFCFCSATLKQRLLKESIKIDAKIPENTRTCDVRRSSRPGRTALGGVTSLSRKCSSLQQEVRGFATGTLVNPLNGLLRAPLLTLESVNVVFLQMTTTV